MGGKIQKRKRTFWKYNTLYLNYGDSYTPLFTSTQTQRNKHFNS